MPEDQPDLFDRLLELLTALVMPVWNDLIRLIPWILILLLVASLLFFYWYWRRADARNQPRLIPLMAGIPPPGVHTSAPSSWVAVAPVAIAFIFFGLIFWWVWIVVGLVIGLLAAIGWLRDAMGEWRQTALAADAAHSTMSPAAATLAIPSGTFRGGAVAPVAPELALVPVVRPEPPEGVHMPGPSPWPFFAPIAIAVVFFGLIFSWWLVIGGVLLGAIAAGGWLRDALREWRSTESVGHAVPKTMEPAEAWPRRLVPVFGAVIVVALLLTALPAVFGWLGSLGPAEATPTPIAVPAKPELAASSAVSFETKTLIVPAGRAFELVFHNKNDAVPHNVEIANGPDRATVYFDGTEITGPADTTYQVPALEPGDYYFLCRIHPNMNGQVQAKPETGPGGGPGGPGASPGGGASPSP